ncbi:MAG: hydrogenase maturation peptidase HycI [Candidatus Thermoplasmatota archaeon]
MTKIMVFCIGNRDGGDDAIGPYIADQLNKHKNHGIDVVDCGTNPENYTSLVKQKKPHVLLIIDAVDMNLKPGEVRIVPKEKISTMHICTHGIPLPILITYLESWVQKILLIGIQPKTYIGSLTAPVKKSGEYVITLIEQKKIDTLHHLPE